MTSKTISLYLALIFCIALLTPSPGIAKENISPSPDIKTLISKVIAAYGGKEVIEGIKAVYANGEIKAVMLGDEGEHVRYMMRDRKLRVETTYKRSQEQRVLNGDKGWRSYNDRIYNEVDEHRYLSMLYQYKQLDLPYGLLTQAYNIKDAGSDLLNGAKVRVLELTDKEGPPMTIYIDLNSFYIIKVAGTFMIEDRVAELSAEFDDFRIIGGMPFPFKITNYASGMKIAETYLKEYFINPGMHPATFR